MLVLVGTMENTTTSSSNRFTFTSAAARVGQAIVTEQPFFASSCAKFAVNGPQMARGTFERFSNFGANAQSYWGWGDPHAECGGENVEGKG